MNDVRVYVGNLPFKTTNEELKKLFNAYGKVKSADVIRYRESGRSKGYAFVIIDEQGGQDAIDHLNDNEYESRILKVLKEKEAVGEIQAVGALGRNNPRVDPSVTPGKQRRAKSDDYGSMRKGEGTPESQKKEFGAKDPLEELISDMETADETEQDQQESEKETS